MEPGNAQYHYKMVYQTSMTKEAVIKQIQTWQQAGQKVVLVTGVFDLLHIEHLRFLTKAKASGDKLVVGLESDARVKSIKGHERPINSQAIRLEQMEALKSVDLVFILPEVFSNQVAWEQLIATLKPDIYAVSSHTSFLANKRAICQKFGVTFTIVHQHNPKFSSSLLLAKITNLP